MTQASEQNQLHFKSQVGTVTRTCPGSPLRWGHTNQPWGAGEGGTPPWPEEAVAGREGTPSALPLSNP